MKTRADLYGKEASSILRDIAMYRVMTEEQILRLYPGKRKQIANLLLYLTRQGRIYHIDDLYCAVPKCAEERDKGLMAAIWVLADFIERVEFHSVGDYPAQIIFFANEDIYEIVYVALGKEVLMSQILSSAGGRPSKYLVLIDDPKQIEQLWIPNVSGYCTVSPKGEIQYYQTE